MNEISKDKFIKSIDNPMNNLLSVTMYAFRYEKETQAIYVQDNHSYVLEREQIETLIKGLQNSLEDFPEKEFKEWNDKRDLKYTNDAKEINKVPSEYLEREKKNGYVYFVQDNTGLIKIGLTRNIRSRIKSMQTSNRSLELLHHIKTNDMVLTEKLFHELYDKKRVGGEWFKLTAKDMELIIKNKYPNAIKDSIKGGENIA